MLIPFTASGGILAETITEAEFLAIKFVGFILIPKLSIYSEIDLAVEKFFGRISSSF